MWSFVSVDIFFQGKSPITWLHFLFICQRANGVIWTEGSSWFENQLHKENILGFPLQIIKMIVFHQLGRLTEIQNIKEVSLVKWLAKLWSSQLVVTEGNTGAEMKNGCIISVNTFIKSIGPGPNCRWEPLWTLQKLSWDLSLCIANNPESEHCGVWENDWENSGEAAQVCETNPEFSEVF